ncbi:MAG TPA: hypothetical protein VHA52_04960, partial [Candidatus Babeliaceae bacterium]|nr:hypothetical protein [Candidatus Babeliaceae bacterium]
MKYYAAVVNEDEIRAACYQPPFQILASYHYFKGKPDLIKMCVEKNYDIIIDSGAFSAANSGKDINIDDYCKFIIDTGVSIYAGLDVIGDAKSTRENTEYMSKQYGLKPIPTFHMGSNIHDLDALLDYPYIALGGLVMGKGIENHCDKVWAYILKNAPKIRVHGFGLTNTELMARYPWYSVDSSSFKGCKRFGRQAILWNGFDWKTIEEEDYLKYLQGMGFDVKPGITKEEMGVDAYRALNKRRWFLYD